ncbi:MAG: FAD-dependent oxidoreductase [Rikenellaceae bacterium]
MKIFKVEESRAHKVVDAEFDLVVVGGGLSGVCAAITSAREGLKVALVQDRSVLGGNASSEVRVWVLGATSHMGNNNRWSREGGLIDEILVENTHRNKEGNPHLFDMVLLDKVLAEKNITLYLDTIVSEVEKSGDEITAVGGFCSMNQTAYRFTAPLFVDATGDGAVGYLSGAEYCVGAEEASEYDEGFAQDKSEYGEQMGNTIFFYSKDTGKPVEYTAPDFALKDVENLIPRVHNRGYLNPAQHGCKYWWLEYGGRLDTIYDAREIKMELLKVVYGVWDYLKNSGLFPETANQTLEWVGSIPGKRENRRFVGHYIMSQKDVIGQTEFYDAVAYGGWSIDLHPADGVYSPKSGCNQWHSKGVYQIPYRSFVPKGVNNLLLAGRIISTTHVANGSTRVMCTCAHGAQAVGIAAALCIKNGAKPADLIALEWVKALQLELQRLNQYIPKWTAVDPRNLVLTAKVEASSELALSEIPFDGGYEVLDYSIAQMLPETEKIGAVTFKVKAEEATEVTFQLRHSLKPENFTPESIIYTEAFKLVEGEQEVTVNLDMSTAELGYTYMCFMVNPKVSICRSNAQISGLTAIYNIKNEAVSNFGKQTPPEGIGVDAFEFWTPKRHPESKLVAVKFAESQSLFGVENVLTPVHRPVVGANCWVAEFGDEKPAVELKWAEAQKISKVTMYFDSDFDNAMENVQMGHHHNTSPCCVAEVWIYGDDGQLLAHKEGNYQTICTLELAESQPLDALKIVLQRRDESTPASLFGLYIE